MSVASGVRAGLRRVRYAPVISRIHIRLYRWTGGRLGHRVLRWRFCLLDTTRRRTGGTHTVPVAYLRHGCGYATVASNAGSARHPAWYWNITTHPTVGLQIGRHSCRATARIANDDEAAILWPRFDATFSAYRTYREHAGRRLPVVLIEPQAASAAPDYDRAPAR